MMQAFHNNPLIKHEYITRVRKHRSADEIVQKKGDGFGYWRNGHGSAVGCTVEGSLGVSGYLSFESELGIPAILAQLEDTIFYGLPFEEASEWPELFLSAICPGTGLSNVWPQFAVWLLDDADCGVSQFVVTAEEKMLIDRVVRLLRDDSNDITEWCGNGAASASMHAAAAMLQAERWGNTHWRTKACACRVASGAAASVLPHGLPPDDGRNSALRPWVLAVEDCVNAAISYRNAAKTAVAEDQTLEDFAKTIESSGAGNSLQPNPTAFLKQSEQLLKLLQTSALS